MLARILVLVAALSGTPAAAQEIPALEPQSTRQVQQDEPRGFPYNVGTSADANVPLRDYMSSRLDGLRVELLNRIELLDRQMQQTVDERDRQYVQRFEAQQEAVAAALSAAKEAVTKAEESANKRFDSVNEFRDTLSDQALTFMSKAEADARFKALEEDTRSNSSRLDTMKAQGEGRGDLWGWIVGAIGLMLAIAMFFMNFNKQRREA